MLMLLIVFLAAVGGGAVVLLLLWPRYRRLRYRFINLEETVNGIGRHIGNTIEIHQRARGGMVFKAPREPSPFDGRGRWELIGGQGVNGSWEKNRYRRARAIAVHEDRLFAGLDGGREGLAEVWAYDGVRWALAGGKGVNQSWAAGSEAVTLITYNGSLYAGVTSTQHGGSLWRLDAGRWTCVADAGSGLWSKAECKTIQAAAVHGGKLYLATWTPDKNRAFIPAIFRFDGKLFERVAGDGLWQPENRYFGAYELWSHTDGRLYAGMGGEGAAADVWRYDGEGWEQVGGKGIRGSWVNPSANWILRFASHQGALVAIKNREPAVAGDFSTIWALDGESWHPVGLGAIPRAWRDMHSFNALSVYRGRLLAGCGGAPAGKASLWELADGRAWRLVAGFGCNGSWGSRDGYTPMSTASSREYPYRLTEYNGDLIAGFGASAGNAQIWRYRPAE